MHASLPMIEVAALAQAVGHTLQPPVAPEVAIPPNQVRAHHAGAQLLLKLCLPLLAVLLCGFLHMLTYEGACIMWKHEYSTPE
jgi:hypothetical protein